MSTARTRTLVALMPALLAATQAFSAPDTMVKQIDVQIELSAVTNVEAAARFATIETDLESALAARMVDRLADVGVNVIIDISEVELSNSFTEEMNLANTRLVGTVKITDDVDNSNFNSYELTVDVNTAKIFVPPGTDLVLLPADSSVYYDAMIAAFADGVVTRINDHN